VLLLLLLISLLCCLLPSQVSVPFIVVVKFDGDKLKAERIYWDQVGLWYRSPAVRSDKM
jgi:hypothetical protein